MEFNISRFKNIDKEEYHCEVITPMFLSGADQKEAEIRTQSIKGALRFWWRAIHVKNSSLEDMKKRENKIFGSTEVKSAVEIKIDGLQSTTSIEKLPKGETFEVVSSKMKHPIRLGIIDYLAYGLHKYVPRQGNQYIRPYIENSKKFTLTVYSPKDFWEEINVSLSALINFGGLGARSRNGFGSIYSDNAEDLELNDLFTDNINIKNFTAFNKNGWVQTFNTHNSWEDALSEIGLKYRTARISLENRHSFNRRSHIAKPIEAKGETIPQNIRNGRQTKSYFLHVSKTGSQYQGQILFLPNSTDREYLEVHQDMRKSITGGAL